MVPLMLPSITFSLAQPCSVFNKVSWDGCFACERLKNVGLGRVVLPLLRCLAHPVLVASDDLVLCGEFFRRSSRSLGQVLKLFVCL